MIEGGSNMEFTEKAVTCGTDKKGDLRVTLELGGPSLNFCSVVG